MTESDSKTMSIKIDTTAIPQVGTNCIICGRFIPINYCYNPVIKICDECRNRLVKILYGKEDE